MDMDSRKKYCEVVALKETLEGLRTIHNNGLVHQHIIVSQIFVNEKGFEPIKISFAVTVFKQHGDNTKAASTSLSNLQKTHICEWAAAPEVYISGNNNYTLKVDIWLVDITTLELAYGAVPVHKREYLEGMIQEIKSVDKMKKHYSSAVQCCLNVCAGGSEKRPGLSKEYAKMVTKCLELVPQNMKGTTEDILKKKKLLL
ncbi:serine/threonine-protein kinase BLUS1-like [Henckelia pumila]|uniref:serine/threonine-protein kinase BLUS1-like n=1 Tax=Henckelia pumila TaxID=405737 RepID=UPI003C6E43E1